MLELLTTKVDAKLYWNNDDCIVSLLIRNTSESDAIVVRLGAHNLRAARFQLENENVRQAQLEHPFVVQSRRFNEMFNHIATVEQMRIEAGATQRVLLLFKAPPLSSDGEQSTNINSGSTGIESVQDSDANARLAYRTASGRVELSAVDAQTRDDTATIASETRRVAVIPVRLRYAQSLMDVQSGSGLIFDRCAPGGTAARDFTVRNLSESTLRFTLEHTVAPHILRFESYETGAVVRDGRIGAHGQLTVRAVLSPTDIGIIDGVVRVHNCHNPQNVIGFDIRAVVTRGTDEVLRVDKATLAFGDCYAYDQCTQSFSVENVSSRVVDIKLSSTLGDQVQFMLPERFTSSASTPGPSSSARAVPLSGAGTTGDRTPPSTPLNSSSALPILSSTKRSPSIDASFGANTTPASGVGVGTPLFAFSPLQVSGGASRRTSRGQAGATDIDSMLSAPSTPLQIVVARELTLAPGEVSVVRVCYRPLPDAAQSDEQQWELNDRSFRVFLHASAPDADTGNDLLDRVTLRATSRVCLSHVEVIDSEIRMGDCAVGVLRAGHIDVFNRSALPAIIKFHCNSHVIQFPKRGVTVAPKQHALCRFDFVPRKVNAKYRKEISLINTRNATNDQFLIVYANNDDPNRVTLHERFYSLRTPQRSNFLNFDNLVVNCPALRTFHVRNRTEARIVLDVSVSLPNEIKVYVRHRDDRRHAETYGTDGHVQKPLDSAERRKRLLETIARGFKNIPRRDASSSHRRSGPETANGGAADGGTAAAGAGAAGASASTADRSGGGGGSDGGGGGGDSGSNGGDGSGVGDGGAGTLHVGIADSLTHDMDMEDGVDALLRHGHSVEFRLAMQSALRHLDYLDLATREFSTTRRRTLGSARRRLRHMLKTDATYRDELQRQLRGRRQTAESADMLKAEAAAAVAASEHSDSGGGGGGGGGGADGGGGSSDGGSKRASGADKRGSNTPMPLSASSAMLASPQTLEENAVMEEVEGFLGDFFAQFETSSARLAQASTPTDQARYATEVRRRLERLPHLLSSGVLVPLHSLELNAHEERQVIVVWRPEAQTRPNLVGKLKKAQAHLTLRLVHYNRRLAPQGIHEQPAREFLLTGKVCQALMSLAQRNINFGPTQRFDSQKAKALVITNRSEVPLLYSVEKLGSMASLDLEVMRGMRVGIIRPYSSKEIPFLFKPSFSGHFNERLVVHNIRDPSRSEVVSVKAFVMHAHSFYVKELSVDFGDVHFEERTNTRSIIITNTSTRSRSYLVAAEDHSFQVCDVELFFGLREAPVRPGSTGGDIQTKIENLERKLKMAEAKGKAEKADKLRQELAELTGDSIAESDVPPTMTARSLQFTVKSGQTAEILVEMLAVPTTLLVERQHSVHLVGTIRISEVKDVSLHKSVTFAANVILDGGSTTGNESASPSGALSPSRVSTATTPERSVSPARLSPSKQAAASLSADITDTTGMPAPLPGRVQRAIFSGAGSAQSSPSSAAAVDLRRYTTTPPQVSDERVTRVVTVPLDGGDRLLLATSVRRKAQAHDESASGGGAASNVIELGVIDVNRLEDEVFNGGVPLRLSVTRASAPSAASERTQLRVLGIVVDGGADQQWSASMYRDEQCTTPLLDTDTLVFSPSGGAHIVFIRVRRGGVAASGERNAAQAFEACSLNAHLEYTIVSGGAANDATSGRRRLPLHAKLDQSAVKVSQRYFNLGRASQVNQEFGGSFRVYNARSSLPCEFSVEAGQFTVLSVRQGYLEGSSRSGGSDTTVTFTFTCPSFGFVQDTVRITCVGGQHHNIVFSAFVDAGALVSDMQDEERGLDLLQCRKLVVYETDTDSFALSKRQRDGFSSFTLRNTSEHSVTLTPLTNLNLVVLWERKRKLDDREKHWCEEYALSEHKHLHVCGDSMRVPAGASVRVYASSPLPDRLRASKVGKLRQGKMVQFRGHILFLGEHDANNSVDALTLLRRDEAIERRVALALGALDAKTFAIDAARMVMLVKGNYCVPKVRFMPAHRAIGSVGYLSGWKAARVQLLLQNVSEAEFVGSLVLPSCVRFADDHKNGSARKTDQSMLSASAGPADTGGGGALLRGGGSTGVSASDFGEHSTSDDPLMVRVKPHESVTLSLVVLPDELAAARNQVGGSFELHVEAFDTLSSMKSAHCTLKGTLSVAALIYHDLDKSQRLQISDVYVPMHKDSTAVTTALTVENALGEALTAVFEFVGAHSFDDVLRARLTCDGLAETPVRRGTDSKRRGTADGARRELRVRLEPRQRRTLVLHIMAAPDGLLREQHDGMMTIGHLQVSSKAMEVHDDIPVLSAVRAAPTFAVTQERVELRMGVERNECTAALELRNLCSGRALRFEVTRVGEEKSSVSRSSPIACSVEPSFGWVPPGAAIGLKCLARTTASALTRPRRTVVTFNVDDADTILSRMPITVVVNADVPGAGARLDDPLTPRGAGDAEEGGIDALRTSTSMLAPPMTPTTPHARAATNALSSSMASSTSQPSGNMVAHVAMDGGAHSDDGTDMSVRLRLPGCRRLHDAHYSLDLGQHVAGTTPKDFSLRLGVDDGAQESLSMRSAASVSFRITALPSDVRWLQVLREQGVVGGDGATVPLRAVVTRAGIYDAFVLVESAENGSDVSVVRVHCEFVARPTEQSMRFLLNGKKLPAGESLSLSIGTILYETPTLVADRLVLENRSDRRQYFQLNATLRDGWTRAHYDTSVRFSLSPFAPVLCSYVMLEPHQAQSVYVFVTAVFDSKLAKRLKVNDKRAKSVQVHVKSRLVPNSNRSFVLRFECRRPALHISPRHIDFHAHVRQRDADSSQVYGGGSGGGAGGGAGSESGTDSSSTTNQMVPNATAASGGGGGGGGASGNVNRSTRTTIELAMPHEHTFAISGVGAYTVRNSSLFFRLERVGAASDTRTELPSARSGLRLDRLAKKEAVRGDNDSASSSASDSDREGDDDDESDEAVVAVFEPSEERASGVDVAGVDAAAAAAAASDSAPVTASVTPATDTEWLLDTSLARFGKPYEGVLAAATTEMSALSGSGVVSPADEKRQSVVMSSGASADAAASGGGVDTHRFVVRVSEEAVRRHFLLLVRERFVMERVVVYSDSNEDERHEITVRLALADVWHFHAFAVGKLPYHLTLVESAVWRFVRTALAFWRHRVIDVTTRDVHEVGVQQRRLHVLAAVDIARADYAWYAELRYLIDELLYESGRCHVRTPSVLHVAHLLFDTLFRREPFIWFVRGDAQRSNTGTPVTTTTSTSTKPRDASKSLLSPRHAYSKSSGGSVSGSGVLPPPIIERWLRQLRRFVEAMERREAQGVRRLRALLEWWVLEK